MLHTKPVLVGLIVSVAVANVSLAGTLDTIPDPIAELKRRVAEAGPSDAGIGQKIMDVVIAYGPLVSECSAKSKYNDGERILADWKQFLDDNDQHLSADQKLLARGRYNNSAGYFWDSDAEYDYRMNGDFVNSPPLFERSEAFHEGAVDLLSRYGAALNAPAEFHESWDKTLADERAEVLRVRGMKLLTQGEFEVEAGGLTRGQDLLTDAIKFMRLAESTATPRDSRATMPGAPPLSFIDYADAILWGAKSDQALLEGDLKKAAEAQSERAKALERCEVMHAHVDTPLSDYFTKRFARDAYVAKQRHDRLEAAAAVQPRLGWLKSVVFLVFAVMVPGVALRWIGPSVLRTMPGLVALLLYALVVAGIGSTLIQWREGLDAFMGGAAKLSGAKGG